MPGSFSSLAPISDERWQFLSGCSSSSSSSSSLEGQQQQQLAARRSSICNYYLSFFASIAGCFSLTNWDKSNVTLVDHEKDRLQKHKVLKSNSRFFFFYYCYFSLAFVSMMPEIKNKRQRAKKGARCKEQKIFQASSSTLHFFILNSLVFNIIVFIQNTRSMRQLSIIIIIYSEYFSPYPVYWA